MALSTTSTRRKLVTASSNSPNSDKASVASTRNKSKTPGLKTEPSEYSLSKKSLMKSAPSAVLSSSSPKKAKLLKTTNPSKAFTPGGLKTNSNGATPVMITNYQRRKLLQEAANHAQQTGSKMSDIGGMTNNNHYNDSNNNINSSFVFCEQNFTRENYAKQEDVYASKSGELRERLDKLRELDILANSQAAKLVLSKMRFGNEVTYAFVNEYVNELRRVEAESDESLAVVKLWYDKQKREIEQIFQNENRRAMNEFQEKRADLKENLRYIQQLQNTFLYNRSVANLI
jgi:hypothetical protein